MRREKPGQKSVADAKKLQYPFLPLVNIEILRIGKLKHDPYFFDKKYISLDIFIDGIAVLAIYIK